MSRLILVHGLKESGKSTLANHLMNKGFVRQKMAGPLKNMIRSLLRDSGMDEETIERCVEGDMKEVALDILQGKSTRFAMERLGHDWRDFFDPSLWVNIVRTNIEKNLGEGRDVVVDDIRYIREIEELSRFDPVLWVITRGNKHFLPVDESTPGGERPLSVDLFERHFKNDWSEVAPLYREVDDALSSIALAA